MNGAKDWIWMMVVGLALGATAHAAKIYSFTGKVSHITDNEVQVIRGSDVREFSMSGMTAEQKDGLRVGEQVTLWYSMEAQGVTRQQAGRAGNQKQQPPSDQQDKEDKDSNSIPPNIQDDRAFYNAKVELKALDSQGA